MSGRRRPARNRRPELSQHFLREATAGRLLQATSISRSDLVVEIGPGRGALTRPLRRRSGRLIAVELDHYLADKLRSSVAGVEVVVADFLDYQLPKGRYVVVGNIPFARSTEIVRKLTRARNPPLDCWLVVQKELGHRLCGRPYEDESLWSLRLKPHWHLEIVDRLGRAEFDPPPSVDSVWLHLRHRGRLLVTSGELVRFVELLEAGFSSPQAVGRGLRSHLSKVQLRRLAHELRFDPADRPGALSFAQWLGVFRFASRDPGATERSERSECSKRSRRARRNKR